MLALALAGLWFAWRRRTGWRLAAAAPVVAAGGLVVVLAGDYLTDRGLLGRSVSLVVAASVAALLVLVALVHRYLRHRKPRGRWGTGLSLAARRLPGLTFAVLALVALVVGGTVYARDDDHDVRPAEPDLQFQVIAPSGESVRQTTRLRVRLASYGACNHEPGTLAALHNVRPAITVQDRREAVVIKLHAPDRDSPQLPPDARCGPGEGLIMDIALPRPIANRALVNGGFNDQGQLPTTVLHATVHALNVQLIHRADLLRYMHIDRNGHPAKPAKHP